MLRAPRNKGEHRGLQSSANYSYTGSQRGELEPYAIQAAFGLLGTRLMWSESSGGVRGVPLGQKSHGQDLGQPRLHHRR